ncbi:MAG: outer membrane beta-barrel family protein [Bacteroidales bacterium]|nr:outer membrane beta-barrel family protein [Bacteroidales bacterium]
MKTKLSLIVSFFVLINLCFAQVPAINNNEKGNGTISGEVFDKQTNKPVEYANVVLYNQLDSQMVTGTITSTDGKFLLKNIPEGKYYMVANFIGYKKKFISDITLSKENKLMKLDPINIEPATSNLSEVSINSDKNDVEYKIDKKVVNVSQNLNTAGGTAVDALKNVPGVTVDNDGNVSLRGSSNFTVLVDGKPSVLTGTEALQQIPASVIEKIEVITNPSAKYDAEGTAGIINILMKKNSLSGTSGIINASAGTGEKYSGDFLFNFKKKKINYFIGANYRDNKSKSFNEMYKESNINDTIDFLTSDGIQKRKYATSYVKTGFDYSINDKNSISLSAQVGNVDFDGSYNTKYHEWINPGTVDLYTYNNEMMKVDGLYFTSNLSHQKKFKKPGAEINSLLFLSYWDGERYEENNEYNTNTGWETQGVNPVRYRYIRNENRNEIRFKSDLTLPLDTIYKIETGIQASTRPILSGQKYQQYQYTSENWVDNDNYKNDMDFYNNVYAAYATFSGKWKKFEYQIGLRGEYNDRLLKQKTLNKSYKYDKLDFFPTASISKQFKKDNQLQLSFSRRIERPYDMLLNPMPMYSDKYFRVYGNPELLPEYINSFELNYMKKYKSSYFSIETYFRQNNNTVNQMLFLDENGGLYSIFYNISKTYYFGTDISGNFDITKWLSVSPSFSIYGYQYEDKNITYNLPDIPLSGNARANLNFKLNKTTRIQLTGFYNSPYFDIQGRANYMFNASMSVRKEFFKKLTAVVSLNNAGNMFKYYAENKINNLYNTFRSRMEGNVVTFSLSYKINNYRATQRREEGIDLNVNQGL